MPETATIRLPKRDAAVRSGLNGRTPEERDEADRMARRIRGEFRWIAGMTSGNVISSGLLPVYTPGFRFDELTPRAMSAVIRARSRRR